MNDPTRRRRDKGAAVELEHDELEQIQGGGPRATTAGRRSLKLGGTLAVKVEKSEIRVGGEKLDFDGSDIAP